MKSRSVKTFSFVAILVGHWIAQFVAWAMAERTSSLHVVWGILSSPLIQLSGSLTDQYFWVIATANSILWAAVVTWVIGMKIRGSHKIALGGVTSFVLFALSFYSLSGAMMCADFGMAVPPEARQHYGTAANIYLGLMVLSFAGGLIAAIRTYRFWRREKMARRIR
jgi:hypothetical protein